MERKKKVQYRLYAALTTAEIIKEIAPFRFSRATSNYALVYTDKRMKAPWVRMTEADASRLTSADYNWLNDCNLLIAAHNLSANEAEVAQNMSQKIDLFERALKEEREKLEG